MAPGEAPPALPLGSAALILKTPSRAILLLLTLLTAGVVACSGGGSPASPTGAPTATSAPPPTAALDLGPARPEVERIIEHIRVLTLEIGPRPAGSAAGAEAIAYGQEQFARWGYQVELQEFSVTSPLLRAATLSVEGGETITATPFIGSPSVQANAALIDAGAGRQGDFPADVAGAVVLIQRGDVPFVDMVARAEAAGASALVIANNEPGRFHGFFRDAVDLPAVVIDPADGEALRALLAAGPVEVSLDVEEEREVTTQNVIARSPGSSCRTVSGGHLDSVPVTTGATDNASGSALVLELARAAAAAGLSGHCFVLFGAEETGLNGSAFFVAELARDERDELAAFLNFDVVAGDGRPLISGGSGLIELAERLADAAGLDVKLNRQPEEIPSDQRSFLARAIPVVVLTSQDFGRIHTLADSFENLSLDTLEPIATLGFALLQELG